MALWGGEGLNSRKRGNTCNWGHREYQKMKRWILGNIKNKIYSGEPWNRWRAK